MTKYKNVLITGASQGLGYEFSKLFAQEKYNLFLVARNREHMQKVADELEGKYNVGVKIYVKDLSTLQAAQDLVQDLEDQSIIIDVLVNNAGFATHGKFVKLSLKEELDEINLNIVTLTTLTKLLAVKMVERGYGKILNISSTAGFFPGPLMAVYYATKTYVLSFSEAISEELKKTGVTVSVLCPGPTRTGFANRAHMENSLLFKINLMDPALVAKIGYRGLMEGKRVIIPGFLNNLIVFLVEVIPHSLTLKYIEILQQV